VIGAAIAVAMAVMLAAGCGAAARPAPLSQPSWVHASLRFVPEPPVARRYETVEVRLTDAAGRPVPAAQVGWSATMRMAGMSPATADLAPRGDGTYGGRTLFVMAGPWIATVRVTADGRSATITIPFEVNE
jgi:hypothetical protein